MSVVLTQQQQIQVDENSKPADELPTYFNGEVGQTLVISRDFEAFLILQGSAAIQAILQWLSVVRELNVEQDDRDALIASALSLDLADANQRATELDSQIDQFDTFKASLNVGPFAGVTEVSLLVGDLQDAIDELVIRSSRVDHLIVINTLLQATIQGPSANEQKQFDSWNTSLVAYSG